MMIMDNSVFGCDVNLVTSKLISVASKKLNQSAASELAQDVIGSAYITFDRTQSEVSFEKFIWVVYKNKLNDELRKKYVRKNTSSLSCEDSLGKTIDPINTSEDLVAQVQTQAQELLDDGMITLQEYNIIIMKACRFTNQEIAKECDLSEGRISQIWNELKDAFKRED
jgi:RNA polymerase sigma factor (sigma-70 family)